MFLQFWRNFFHRKHFLPTQLTHPMMHAAAPEDFPCASQEPFTVPKLSLLLLCAAPEAFLAPGLELKNFRASFFQKRLPLFACTGDPHDPSAIHWARDFSSATATVLRCGVQGTSAAPAIHPVLPCFSVEGTSSTPAIHAVPPNNFCSDCSLSLIFIMPDVLDIQFIKSGEVLILRQIRSYFHPVAITQLYNVYSKVLTWP